MCRGRLVLFFQVKGQTGIADFAVSIVVTAVFQRQHRGFPAVELLGQSGLSAELREEMSGDGMCITALLVALLRHLRGDEPFGKVTDMVMTVIIRRLRVRGALELFGHLAEPAETRPVLHAVVDKFPRPYIFRKFGTVAVSSDECLAHFHREQGLFSFLVDIAVRLPFAVIDGNDQSFRCLEPLRQLPEHVRVFLHQPVRQHVVQIYRQRLEKLGVCDEVFSFGRTDSRMENLIGIEPGGNKREVMFRHLAVVCRSLETGRHDGIGNRAQYFHPVEHPVIELLSLYLNGDISEDKPRFHDGVCPAVRVIRVVNIAAQGQVCQLRIPKAFRYEGENVEIPASVSDDRFCHFSGNHCFGNGRDILRFFAHGVVTDCSRTVRLRNIAQLEAVPALRAARDDSFYTSGCEETSRNMAQHLYFLAFDGCFHDLFREQVFRQPFYGRYDVIVPHTVSF